MERIIYILAFLAVTTTSFGQARKALSLYNNKRYAQAIPYFKKVIKKDNSTKYKTKLADCYRKTNKLKKAEALYSKIVQRKHYSSKIMLYYGDVLMGLGKYPEAKSWYLKYTAKNPKDKKGQLKADACDYIKSIKPYFSNVEFVKIPFNSEADDSNPIIFRDKIYFASDRKKGFNLLKKKSGWTGRDFMRIYSVDIQDDSTFSAASSLPNRINNLNKNTGKPSFSRKGDFYFTKNTNKVSKDGTYKLHIFHAQLQPNGSWSKPDELPFCQRSINYLHPSISEDGKTLFFASNRKGGEGKMDLFISEKHGDTWGIPYNIGSKINTPSHEAFPFIHPSGKLFFSSKGHNGFGGFDIFVSEKNDKGFWQEPINLGAPVNSSGDDIGFFADSLMQRILFSSTRTSGNDDVFMGLLKPSSSLATNPTPIKILVTQTSDTLISTENLTTQDYKTVLIDKTSHDFVATEPKTNTSETKQEQTSLVIIQDEQITRINSASDTTLTKRTLKTRQDNKTALPYHEIVSDQQPTQTLKTSQDYVIVPNNKNQQEIQTSPMTQDYGNFKISYENAYAIFGITIMQGDTILLAAPSFPQASTIVPYFLTAQLDQLIPAMYLSKDLQFDIYYCSKEQSKDNIAQRRADAIAQYLITKEIPKTKITATGIDLNTSENFPIFADFKNIVILARASTNQ